MLACPPLTTVSQPMIQMGERAAEKLIELIEKRNISFTDEILPVKLEIRGSTGMVSNK
jgi:LacI family transcriptional regulator